jgi:type IV fimbrial biogenesis protein FimT
MRSRGFTLIEFAITLGIVAILVSMALPTFGAMLANSQVRSASTTLNAAFGTARAEALRTRTSVTICARIGNTCATGTATNAWNSGWLVFVDTNANGSVDTGERIIVESGVGASGLDITGNAQFVFRSSGTANSQGAITIRKSGANSGRDLTITSGGRTMTKAVDVI